MSSLEGVFRPDEIQNLISVTEVAKQTPYSPEFVRLLARQNKIKAVKVGRDWLTTHAEVLRYMKGQQHRYEQKLALLKNAQHGLLSLLCIGVFFVASFQAQAASPKYSVDVMPQSSYDSSPFLAAFDFSSYPNAAAVSFEQVRQQIISSTQSLLDPLAAFSMSAKHLLTTLINGLNTPSRVAVGKQGTILLASTPEPSPAQPDQNAAATIGNSPRGSVLTTESADSSSPRLTPAATKSAVLGASTVSDTHIEDLINQILQGYIGAGKLIGPTGPQGAQGPAGTMTVITQSPNPNPVGYYPPSPPANSSGGSMEGISQLSSQNLISDTVKVNNTFTSVGGSTFTGNTTFNGAATFNGTTNLTGTTTIAGLTVTGFNPQLTTGSITFQGPTGLAQDNANFFYDATNHRLGILTTAPAAALSIGAMNQFQVNNSGNLTAGTYNGNTISTGTGTLTLNANTLIVSGNTAVNQNLRTTDSPTFASATFTGNVGIGTTVVDPVNGITSPNVLPILNVQTMFGILPSNTAAANLTACNSMITALNARTSGAIVAWPAGTYNFSLNCEVVLTRSNIKFIGSGRGTTVIHRTGLPTYVSCSNTGTDFCGLFTVRVTCPPDPSNIVTEFNPDSICRFAFI